MSPTSDVDRALAHDGEFNRLLLRIAIEEEIQIGHRLALLIKARDVQNLAVDFDLEVGLTGLGLAKAGVGEVQHLGLSLEFVGGVTFDASSEKRHFVWSMISLWNF